MLVYRRVLSFEIWRMANKFKITAVLLFVTNLVALYCIHMYACKDAIIELNVRPNEVSSHRLRHLPRGYLVNLKYDGQQASTEHALVLQQCWLSALNLTSVSIVEPFLRQTVYQGYPPKQSESVGLVFSDLHDVRHYNSISRKLGFAQVATWNDFIENAPRSVVFVNLGCLYAPHTHTSIACPNNWTKCCSVNPKQDGMDFLHNHGFCIVKVIDLETLGLSLSSHNVRNVLYAPWEPEEVVLVFSHWMQANSAQNIPQCHRVFRKSAMEELHVPSRQLLQESSAYRERYLGGKAKGIHLSVMIRVERVIEQSAEGGHSAIARQNKTKRRAYLDKCFTTLLETVKRFGNKRRPFVMTDVGRFSSNSWNRILSELNYSQTEAKHVFNTTKKAVEVLVNQQFDEWEESFVHSTWHTNHWQSPAYIAALQRAIAINSDCLLLFGGGNFQEVALSAYLHKHSNKSTHCIHFVCVSRQLKQNLMHLL